MTATDLPILIPVTFLAFALLITLFGFWKEKSAYPLAVIGMLTATCLSVFGLLHIYGGETIQYAIGGWRPPIGIEFVYDTLSAFVVLVINAVALIAIIHSHQIGKHEFPGKRGAYYAVTMLLMFGFNGMVITGDLFNLYVFLEISSLSSYALIAIGDKKAPFAAFRYLIVGTMGGSFFLLGVGFLYIVTGTLNIQDMSAMLPQVIENSAVIGGLILMVLGMGIKAAVFPLHGWLPDSYTHASSSSSALIAPIGTKVAAYVILRVVVYLYGDSMVEVHIPVTEILGVLSALGILYGSIMAMAQSELKKMLAYSSISQIGYVMMGISLTNPYGFIGAVLHILNHALMKGTLFMVSGNLRRREGHSLIPKFDESLRKKYPWSMAAFTTAALSMIGIPPLAGFFSKWYLALGTIQNSSWLLLATILLSSLLNAVYFFNVLERVYMRSDDAESSEEGPAEISPERSEPALSMLLTTTFAAAALIVVGLFNASVVAVIQTMFPAGL